MAAPSTAMRACARAGSRPLIRYASRQRPVSLEVFSGCLFVGNLLFRRRLVFPRIHLVEDELDAHWRPTDAAASSVTIDAA